MPHHFRVTTGGSQNSAFSHATTVTANTSQSFPFKRDRSKVMFDTKLSTNDAAAKPVDITTKPASKYSLGSVTVQFASPPRFHTFRVHVRSLIPTPNGGDSTREIIKSQKLRRITLELFVRQAFPDLGENFAINTRTGLDWDHVIFPFLTDAQGDWLISQIHDKFVVVDDVKKMPKAGSEQKARSIGCWFKPGALTDDDFKKITAEHPKVKDPKANNLSILIQTLISKAATGVRTGYRDRLSTVEAPYRHIDISMTLGNAASGSHASSVYEIKQRQQIIADLRRNVVYFDYDLVPIIPSKRLSDVLEDVLGGRPVVKNNAFVVKGHSKEVDLLPMIKNMLCGLMVHCAYIPNKQSRARMLQEEACSEGRCFQIKDVKFAGDKTRFVVDPQDGTEYNVADYFEQVIRGGELLQHADWPVIRDDRNAWFPMEMLYVAPGQVFTHCGHLKPKLLDMTRNYMKNSRELQLCQQAQDEFNSIAETEVGKDDLATPWLESTTRNQIMFNSNDDVASPMKSASPREVDTSIALLWIRPNDNQQPSTIHERVKQDLQRKYRSPSMFVCKENDILEESQTIKRVFEDSRKRGQRIILAITSEPVVRGHLTSAVSAPRQVFARLRSLCELEHGIMLVCQTGTSLAKFYKKCKGPTDHIPTGIQRQMDFMLGNSNFFVKLSPEAVSKKLMIVGAHIMHKTLGMNEHSKYSPSIAAVVANTGSMALAFPGSVRFQRTTARAHSTFPKKRIPQDRIIELKDMLTERFRDWSPESPPDSILFYRDSISFENNDATEECQAVTEAFKSKFPQSNVPPKITYVLVNRNMEILYQPTGSDTATRQLAGDFLMEPGKTKYRFYVIRNDIGIDMNGLQELTRDLNDSNQLHAQFNQVAKVLPLTWAKKLAERMYAHVAFAGLEDKLVSIDRKLKDIQTEIEQENAAVKEVKKHFKVDGETKRTLPWHENISSRMFYL